MGESMVVVGGRISLFKKSLLTEKCCVTTQSIYGIQMTGKLFRVRETEKSRKNDHVY